MLRLIYSIAIITAMSIVNIAEAGNTLEGEAGFKNVAYSENEELQISVFQNSEDHRYIVSFSNEGQEPVALSLTDEEGNRIYEENIDGKGIYSRRFDLINLEDGEYIVKIGNESNSLEKEVLIK